MPTTEPFDSGTLVVGGATTFVHRFNTEGSFGYRCSFHSNIMKGTIDVTAAASDSVLVNIQDDFFSPATASIKPTGYARWVTASGTRHSVTRP